MNEPVDPRFSWGHAPLLSSFCCSLLTSHFSTLFYSLRLAPFLFSIAKMFTLSFCLTYRCWHGHRKMLQTSGREGSLTEYPSASHARYAVAVSVGTVSGFKWWKECTRNFLWKNNFPVLNVMWEGLETCFFFVFFFTVWHVVVFLVIC